jgi:hypothetical protein
VHVTSAPLLLYPSAPLLLLRSSAPLLLRPSAPPLLCSSSAPLPLRSSAHSVPINDAIALKFPTAE